MDLNTPYKNLPKSLIEWKDLISLDNVIRLYYILGEIFRIKNKYIIYPPIHKIFRAFAEVKPSDVKVVIIGLEPNHDGTATGLAFDSNDNNIIIETIKKEIKIHFPVKEVIGGNRIDFNHGLGYLTSEGVLLLNTILTVEKASPLSHSGIGWQKFTTGIIQELSTKYTRVVYILWGFSALQYRKYINEEKNLVLTCTHPSYAIKNNIRWKCDNFKRTNSYLKLHKKKPINWI